MFAIAACNGQVQLDSDSADGQIGGFDYWDLGEDLRVKCRFLSLVYGHFRAQLQRMNYHFVCVLARLNFLAGLVVQVNCVCFRSPFSCPPHSRDRHFDFAFFKRVVHPPPTPPARRFCFLCSSFRLSTHPHQAVHTPGHSRGSITLLYANKPSAPGGSFGEDEGIAFTGDHLALSGRTGALTGFPRCCK